VREILDLRTIGIALSVVAAWVVIVVISGTGTNWFPYRWDFENTGQFGDSFGSLSAIMASLAALSALATFRATQSEIEHSRSKEREREDEQSRERQRLLDREQSQDARIAKSEFEQTFFQLLQTFNAIVSDTDYTSQSKMHQDRGRDAFRRILTWFENSVQTAGSHEKAFENTLKQFRNDLYHYFRFLYHLVNFVHASSGIDKYFYVRLVRALLSDAEIALLALNCLYGEGKEKFKPLVEEYALLHNLSPTYKKRLSLEGKFYPRAFGRDLAPSRLDQT